MGIYGKRLVFESVMSAAPQMTKTEQIIESNFEFLNEAGTTTILKKKIGDLSKKENITKEEVDKLAAEIKTLSDKEQKADLISVLALCILGYIGAAIGVSVGGTNLLPSIGGVLASVASLIKASDPYTISNGPKVYSKIIKLEAQITNKIKKIQALEEPTPENKETLKELNKTLNLLQKIKPAFKNKIANRESAIDEAVLLEFKGKEDKTEAFKIIIEEMAGICEFNYKKIQLVKKSVDDMVSCISKATKAKDSKTAGALAIEARNIGKAANKDLDALTKEYGVNYPVSLTVFKKDLKSFTVKYSEVTMAEKKRIADKLKTLKGKIEDVAKEYSASNKTYKEKIVKLNDDIDKNGRRGDLNEAMTNLLEWLSYLVNECNLTLSDIDYTISDLKIEKTEKSIVYKVLNPTKK